MDETVALLGVPRHRTPGGAEPLPPGRATCLAALLAVRGDWLGRDEAVAMLWPDAVPARGRANLSQLLYAARRHGWGAAIEADAARLRWPVASDVAAFRQAASDGDWANAVAAYGGDLLADVAGSGADAFDAWLDAEREDLRATWHEALRRHADDLARAGRGDEAIRALRRLLASDDLREDAVQALMRLEALAGHRDAALQTYATFRARLATELALAPLDATADLAAAVRRGDVAPVAEPDETAGAASRGAAAPERDVRPGPVRGLDADPTPFVGRALELTELHVRFGRDALRLVTVLGRGGAGKTRVARQLARERAGHHADGAVWVALGAATSEGEAISAIARALGIQVPPRSDALAGALAGADLLLVLDQAEHLPALPGLAVALLDGCPDVRLLVTSRHALDVPGEVLVALPGLSVPPRDDAADPETYDAVGLLMRAAHRVRPDFHPTGAERAAVGALTRLLAGSPLALELAAGWLRFLEPSELLAEVRADLDVLRARDPAIEPEHASLRAAFESSWKLLAAPERDALRRLAVFRGGCTREAAAAVADVPLAALLTLTNRSLLHREGTTRFHTHPEVQRFAGEKLAEERALAREMGARHTAHYLALAEEADRRLDGPEQPAALTRLDAEGGNLAAALDRTLAEGATDAATQLVAALGRYWRWRGLLREGLAWCDRLAALPSAGPTTSARVRATLVEGLLRSQSGDNDGAARAFAHALEGATALDDPVLLAATRTDQAIVAWRRGDFAGARELFEAAVAAYRTAGRTASLAGTLGNLGNVLRDAGDLGRAHAHYDEALALLAPLGHPWETANVRNNKAIAHAYGDDLEGARAEFERALDLQRAIGDAPGAMRSLMNIGNVHMDTGAPERAQAIYEEGLEQARRLGERDAEAHVHVNLGILAQRRGDFDAAHEHLAASLRLRTAMGARALAMQSVNCFLDLAVARGDAERALVLAGAVRALEAATGAPLTPRQQPTFDAAVAAARSTVPAARAAELERRGAALPEREAYAYATATRASA